MADKKKKEEKEEEKKDSPFIKVEKEKPDLRKKEQPLIDLKVTNPITYIKSWWKRVLGNEGLELKLKIKPLTAIAIAIIIVSVSLGLGRFKLPFKIPFFEYTVEVKPTSTPDPTRDGAFIGQLFYKEDTNEYFLISDETVIIKLINDNNISLDDYMSKRVLITGKYNIITSELVLKKKSDIKEVPIGATVPPTPTTKPTNTPEPVPTPEVTLETPTQTSTDSSSF